MLVSRMLASSLLLQSARAFLKLDMANPASAKSAASKALQGQPNQAGETSRCYRPQSLSQVGALTFSSRSPAHCVSCVVASKKDSGN